jgi:hypothetical protein
MNAKEICQKIREIYPDIGVCGIDLDAVHNVEMDRWEVRLKRNQKELKTFLEPGDAELCMEGKQCLSLAIEINQLKDSIDRLPSKDSQNVY